MIIRDRTRNFGGQLWTHPHPYSRLNIPRFRWRKRKRSPDPLEKALIKDQTRLDESEDETEGEREDILDLILSGMFVRFPELVKRREEKGNGFYRNNQPGILSKVYSCCILEEI